MESEYIKCPSCKNTVSISYAFCPYCGYDLRPIIRFKARREIGIKDIVMNRLRFILIKPHRVFKEIALSPDLIGPFMIFTLAALLITLRFTLVLKTLTVILFLYLLAVSLIEVFILNIFIALIIHFIVRLLGGTGDFSITFSVYGYSYLPMLIGLAAIDIQLASTPTSILLADNPTTLTNVFAMGATIYAVFLLIIGFFLAFGISYSHGIDIKFSFLASYIAIGLAIAIILA